MITPLDTYDDQGSYAVGGRQFTNARGARNNLVDVRKALTVSSDVFYYWLGERFWNERGKYGPAAIQDAARSLGMGSYTDVDLPFESNGRVDDPASRERLHKENPTAFPFPEWYTGYNLNMAVGQGDTAITPMQLANAYATFVNGGTVFAPRVGDAVLDRQGQELRKVDAKVVGRTELSTGILGPLMAGFRGVVADPLGTAFYAFDGFPLAQFPVAGKTGTAEVAGKQDTSLFAAYAPADAPRYVVSVVLEESGLGSSAAAPVARRVLEAIAVKEGISTEPPAAVNRVEGRD
jgi:penicillin-binding protein 2